MQPNDRALYCIIKTTGNSIQIQNQLALHVELWEGKDGKPDILCFYDTDRGHMIPGDMTDIEDHAFRFKDTRGGEWEFKEVTIKEFRHRLAKYVINGPEIAKRIKTTEDLWEWYRKTFPI